MCSDLPGVWNHARSKIRRSYDKTGSYQAADCLANWMKQRYFCTWPAVSVRRPGIWIKAQGRSPFDELTLDVPQQEAIIEALKITKCAGIAELKKLCGIKAGLTRM